MAAAGPSHQCCLGTLDFVKNFLEEMKAVDEAADSVTVDTAMGPFAKLVNLAKKVDHRCKDYANVRKYLCQHSTLPELNDFMIKIRKISILLNVQDFTREDCLEEACLNLYIVRKGVQNLIFHLVRCKLSQIKDHEKDSLKEVIESVNEYGNLFEKDITLVINTIAEQFPHLEEELLEGTPERSIPIVRIMRQSKDRMCIKVDYSTFEYDLPENFKQKIIDSGNWDMLLERAPDNRTCSLCCDARFSDKDSNFCMVDCCDHLYCSFCMHRFFRARLDSFCVGVNCFEKISYWIDKDGIENILAYRELHRI